MHRPVVLVIATASALGCTALVGVEDVELESATTAASGSTGPGGGSTSSTSSAGGAGGCSNGTQDAGETDEDCGGPDCDGCPDGDACASGSDCQSGVCDGNICQPPTCTDGVKNGGETDADCGGAMPCPRCGYGALCAAAADCAAGATCDRGVCAPDPIGVWQQSVSFPGNNTVNCSLTYDAQAELSLLFGGNGSDNNLVDEDWVFDGASWSAPPGTAPAPRFYHAAAYSSASATTLLFGGALDGIVLDDQTWQWDGATKAWAQKVPVHRPLARWAHAMAYDLARDRVVLFGGRTGPDLVGDTWEWDGTDWQEVVPGVGLTPGTRHRHQLVYDEVRQRVVLFGGEELPDVALGDTWTYDGVQWSDHGEAQPSPSARSQAGMAYDSIRGRVVVFGGAVQDTPVAPDTWEWDGAAWQQIATAQSPGADFRGAMAFDRSRARTVYKKGLSPQTWEYFTLATPCFANAECGGGYCAERLCCASACTDPCRQCNSDGAPGTCVPVVDAEDPDSCSGDMHCDASGQCVAD